MKKEMHARGIKWQEEDSHGGRGNGAEYLGGRSDLEGQTVGMVTSGFVHLSCSCHGNKRPVRANVSSPEQRVGGGTFPTYPLAERA